MLKIVIALAALAAPVVAVVALVSAGCTSPTPQPTGCVYGVNEAGPGVVCDLAWACSENTEHYQVLCTESDGNYSCTCTTDTSTAVTVIVVNPFECNGGGGQGAALGCGWDLQL
jgi:hypothetical protein